MRSLAYVLLLAFAFAIPWEYSVDFGPPWGNVARLAGLLVLLVAVPAVAGAGRIRALGPMQALVLALFLWFCCSAFWTMDLAVTIIRVRAFVQVMMIVWLGWELIESPAQLRALVRAAVAGCWVLAILTLLDLRSPAALAAGEFRFAAYGQDPNDVARFLDLGLPLAALLGSDQSPLPDRILGIGYLPLALAGVLLTASRGGFLAAAVAFAGCAVLLARYNPKTARVGLFALPPLAAALWMALPHEIFARLATIPQQLRGGDLNQRLNIWSAGWQAFTQAPLFGSGAGTFVHAARLAPIDTAHNTALSLAVDTGLVGLFLATAVFICAIALLLRAPLSLRLALGVTLLVWVVASLVGTVEENRITWLLFAIIAVAARLAEDSPAELAACFPEPAARELEPAFAALRS